MSKKKSPLLKEVQVPVPGDRRNRSATVKIKQEATFAEDSLKDDGIDIEGELPEERGVTFKSNQKIRHDLYRLENEFIKRDTSWTKTPNIQMIEHSHYYHTVDSNGREMKLCGPMGGHFHIMKMVEPQKTVKTKGGGTKIVPAKYECSGPMRFAKTRSQDSNGNVRFTRKMVPDGRDTHVHEVKYEGSEYLEKRKFNAEAAILQSQDPFVKNAQVAGVQSAD